MSTLDIFNKWFKIVTETQLNWNVMDECIEELLPGFSFRRSGHGPRAIKYICDSDKVVFKSRNNYDVGMHALKMAANTDYKKAILDAYNTKITINSLLHNLRKNRKTFDISIIVDDDTIDIRVN
ncbi:MAG: hypothetical protein JW725_00900 [Candidatus Babeliaceae bacterium]|nr:hypothetical protein [Candidatus Babeliaceae bacterium]